MLCKGVCMALYVYKGLSLSGKQVDGSLDAPSEAAVKEMLQKKNIYPTFLMLAHKAEKKEFFLWRLFKPTVPFKDLLLFTKQLNVLLKSSVPLLQAIDLLDDQFTGTMHTILISIKDILKEGGSFADGLKRYPHVFENIYIQLVRAGEASGKLETILDRLIEYLESKELMRSKISAALRGPLINLALIGLVTIFLVTQIIPQLAGTFSKGGAELPWPTAVVIALSDLILNHYILLGAGSLLFVFSLVYIKATEWGAYKWDALLLRLPITSFFSRMNAVVQFCSTLGMLLEAGVILSESLDIVCNIIDNQVLKDALREARDKIIKQGKIAQYLKQSGVFPPIATYLIATGEESGKLDTMLLEISKNYEKDLLERADTLSSLIDPLMMVLTGLVVGFIVIAVALPMSQMGSAMGV